MMSQVHPNSFISKEVQLGNNVKIGPFCNINGNIKIDNQSIYDSTIYSLRRNISLVSQDTTLFDDTIKNNIK